MNETRELFQYLSFFDVEEKYLKFDLFLARGLDYYTGPIFETVVKEPKIGSVTGGGRYDHLIGLFTKQDLPAVGSSIGLERIITAMDELGMFPEHLKTPTHVLVTVFDETTREFSIQLTQELRNADINVNLYLGTSKLRGQLGYASEKGIPFVIIAGPDEIQQGQVTLKNLIKGEQQQISRNTLIPELKKMINDLFRG
jgi:histidyl-tRNA synthetase